MAKTIFILFAIATVAIFKSCDGMPSTRAVSGGTKRDRASDRLVINTAPGYHTIQDCDKECPLNKDTVCKLDCMLHDGVYPDCIYRFYSKTTGNPWYKCWE